MDYRQTPRLRLEFWRAFKLYMASARTFRCGRASSDSWMHHNGALNGGSLFTMIRVRLGEIGTQFALDDATASTIFSFLQTRRSHIDAAFAEELQWRSVGSRTHEIEVRRPADLGKEREWSEYFAWFGQQLGAFQDTLWPLVGRVPPAGEKGTWDEQTFFASLAAYNPTSVGAARELLDWSAAKMPSVYWGHGRRFGSFAPGIRRQGTVHSVVSVWTDGTAMVRFGALKKTPLFCREALRVELLGRLNDVPHFDLPREVLDGYPAIPLPLLDDPTTLARFLGVLDWSVGVLSAH